MHNISKKKIAVIGSGIAGISASYFLSSKYDVHLFEKFHLSGWKDKFTLLNKFNDDRLVTFGCNLIFNDAQK